MRPESEIRLDQHAFVMKYLAVHNYNAQSFLTQGLYFSLKPSITTESDTSANFKTGVPKLGNVPQFSDQFEVPGLKYVNGSTLHGTTFDVFPGSPSIDDDGNLAFKGNYAVGGIGKTGVCKQSLFFVAAIGPLILTFHVSYQVYRRLDDVNDTFGGNSSIHVIANSDTAIPMVGVDEEKCSGVNFGSTASPSIAGE